MKYIKLKEDHRSRVFVKGDIIMIPDESLEAWMETGIAEKSTKAKYEKHISKDVDSTEEDNEE